VSGAGLWFWLKEDPQKEKMKRTFGVAAFISLILTVFFPVLRGYAETSGAGVSQTSPWTSEKLACLEKAVYFNECSGKPANLATWRSDEDFPSLGIGHFIWYPPEKKGPYQESFPTLLVFLKENGVVVPAWLEQGPPWRDREEFQKDLQSERMVSLRAFLEQTRALQVLFIIKRMDKVLPKMLEATLKEKKPLIEQKYRLVAEAPGGRVAMIDYVNFKGEGTSLTERLQGQGWGLLQVLEAMKIPEDAAKVLPAFVHAAEQVLEKRVAIVLTQKDESRALKGWKTRVRSYLKITC